MLLRGKSRSSSMCGRILFCRSVAGRRFRVPVGSVTHAVLIFSQLEKGIKLVQQGQYAEAVALFTEAIKCDPRDYR